jgi:DNA polymerase-1
MTKLPTLYLIDGSSYIFRAFYAVRPLSNSKGLPTNALYGFTQMIMRLLKEENPTHLAIIFDSKEPTERDEIYPEYKANRSEPPDDLVPQFPYFRQITEALDIHTVLQPGVEADDIIGTMAHAHEAAGGDVVIVTGDKDFMQMVSKQVTLLDTMKEKRNGIPEVKEKFGVTPEEVVEVMGLMGDAVDNIPGVKGVGPKTAIKLIQKFHTVENLYKHLDDVEPGSLREKLKEQKEGAMLSRNLVEIRKNIPLDFTLDGLKYAMPSPAKFTPLFKELEFTRLLKEMSFPVGGGAVPVIPAESPEGGSVQRESSIAVHPGSPLSLNPDAGMTLLVVTEAVFENWITQLSATDPITFMVVTDGGHPLQEPLVGISLSSPTAGTIYCPVGHRVLESQLKLEELQAASVLWNSKRSWWGYDVKPQLETLDAHGIHIAGRIEDGMLLQYLLGGSTAKNGEIFLERAGLPISKLADLLGKGAKKHAVGEMDVAAIAQWAGAVAQGLAALLPALKGSLGDVLPLYNDMELPLFQILKQMEKTGVLVDTSVLSGLHDDFAERLSALEKEIHALAGAAFNIQSPKQLGNVLFNKLQIPVVKKTKTGASTDSDVLEELAPQYPIAQRILEYRQLAKLQSTYVDALPKLADPKTGRIHTSYNQAVAATGRLSSSDPNLQNIPIRSDDGRKIRRAFVAAKDSQLISADYSQIELRILAHMADEPLLIEAFNHDEDIHTLTASQIFNVPIDNVTKSQRAAGKTVNFAVLYGQSAFGLSHQLGIPAGEAKTYIDHYFARYTAVASYRDNVLEEARAHGYVETLFGRRRQFPDLKHANKGLRAAAERMAFNTVFQGTAADIIKRAMIRVSHSLSDVKDAHMIMQVHDELIVEAPQVSVKAVEKILVHDMSAAASLKVPLTVDVASGLNWDEC